jgi:hypothetical protein
MDTASVNDNRIFFFYQKGEARYNTPSALPSEHCIFLKLIN